MLNENINYWSLTKRTNTYKQPLKFIRKEALVPYQTVRPFQGLTCPRYCLVKCWERLKWPWDNAVDADFLCWINFGWDLISNKHRPDIDPTFPLFSPWQVSVVFVFHNMALRRTETFHMTDKYTHKHRSLRGPTV